MDTMLETRPEESTKEAAPDSVLVLERVGAPVCLRQIESFSALANVGPQSHVDVPIWHIGDKLRSRLEKKARGLQTDVKEVTVCSLKLVGPWTNDEIFAALSCDDLVSRRALCLPFAQVHAYLKVADRGCWHVFFCLIGSSDDPVWAVRASHHEDGWYMGGDTASYPDAWDPEEDIRVVVPEA